MNYLFDIFRKLKPSSLLARLRGKIYVKYNIWPVVSKAFMEKYSTNDFDYDNQNMDKSLDLLAICSDDADALAEATNKLTSK